ncbi:MAG: hypothetical protein DRH24_14205 [Deltaproteobacteria bacterium]|nr:MAG: hypothetical protein DRH24_14205 [Deltaproteobacteria bacterium]
MNKGRVILRALANLTKNQKIMAENSQEQEQGTPNENPEPEEKEVEEEDLNDFGEEEDLELLDAEELAKQAKELKKKLATAIKQKRKWRERALQASKQGSKQEAKQGETPQKEVKAELPDLDKMIEAKLREKELEELDVSDTIKEEIRKHIKVGTYKSVKEALNSPYISFLKKQEEEKKRAEQASISPTQRGGGGAKRDFSEMSPKDFDLTTPEGRKEFHEYLEWLKKQG